MGVGSKKICIAGKARCVEFRRGSIRFHLYSHAVFFFPTLNVGTLTNFPGDLNSCKQVGALRQRGHFRPRCWVDGKLDGWRLGPQGPAGYEAADFPAFRFSR